MSQCTTFPDFHPEVKDIFKIRKLVQLLSVFLQFHVLHSSKSHSQQSNIYNPSLCGWFFLYYFTISLKTLLFLSFFSITVYTIFLFILYHLCTFSRMQYLFRSFLYLYLTFCIPAAFSEHVSPTLNPKPQCDSTYHMVLVAALTLPWVLKTLHLCHQLGASFTHSSSGSW